MPIDMNSSITDVVREYARPDVHIGAGEDESPWVPFIENVSPDFRDHQTSKNTVSPSPCSITFHSSAPGLAVFLAISVPRRVGSTRLST